MFDSEEDIFSIFSTESHGSCSPKQHLDAQARVCNRTGIQTCHRGILGLRDASHSQTIVTNPYETPPLQVEQSATQSRTNAQELSSMPSTHVFQYSTDPHATKNGGSPAKCILRVQTIDKISHIDE